MRRLAGLDRNDTAGTGVDNDGVAFLDEDLASLLQHLLHRLEIETLARHVGAQAVGLVDLNEALSLTLSLVDDLLSIGFRFLNDALRLTACLRNDAVAISFGLVS